MNKPLGSLVIKYIATFLAAWIAFGLLGNNPIGSIALLALIGTIVNYLVGDLFILPNTGSAIAALADGVLGALIAYLYGMDASRLRVDSTMLITFGIFVALAEFAFHAYVKSTRNALTQR